MWEQKGYPTTAEKIYYDDDNNGTQFLEKHRQNSSSQALKENQNSIWLCSLSQISTSEDVAVMSKLKCAVTHT